MKKRLLAGIGVVVLLLVIYLFVRGNRTDSTADLMTEVKRGQFRVEIETTGELEAKNSVKILGPAQLRDFRIWEITIQRIIDEGTIVKKGDWIATLDPSEFQNRFSEKQIELEKANSRSVQTQLDTTLQMRQARDELVNLKYAEEEKRIILQQSKFEPPATIKQNEMNLEKAVRAYEQAIENTRIKKRQNNEKMREVAAEVRKIQNEFTTMTTLMQSFNIIAPEPGMVIYVKGYDGKPIKSGSRIHMWDPTVATLPDLTKMMSKTYVNEVDVRSIKSGQSVEIGLDAYPDKKLTGKVVRVANVGEQRPNSDAKVFEVAIEVDGSDAAIRPAMTTSNKIIASVVDSALYVPLECLHSQADTITYVYKRDGMNTVRQEVVLGQSNSNDVIITAGLRQGDKIYLSIPAGKQDNDIVLLEQMKGKRQKKQEQQEKQEPAPATPSPVPVVLNK